MKQLFLPAPLSGDWLNRLLAVADGLPLYVTVRPFGFEVAVGNEAADSEFRVIATLGSAVAEYSKGGQVNPTWWGNNSCYALQTCDIANSGSINELLGQFPRAHPETAQIL